MYVAAPTSQHIKLIAGCPGSKTLWFHNKLKCFACNFSQKENKHHEPIKKIPWITKRMKKNDEIMLLVFCPSCTLGKPWTIHSNDSYMMV
jgi:hypothetical protein